MHERHRWTRSGVSDADFGQCPDAELDRMVNLFLSRKLSGEDREYRKVLKGILEKYNIYFKSTKQGLPAAVLKFESYLYVKVMHKVKKILRYLHSRLQNHILVT
jgi:hypothetical protein